MDYYQNNIIADDIDDGRPVYSTPYTVDLFEMGDTAQIDIYVNAVRSLPKSMSVIMTDQATARTINESIAPMFSLSPDKAKELTRIVRGVLMSTIYVGDLIVEIQQRIGVDEQTSQRIANELVAQVFKSAMDDIKSTQVARFSDRIGKPKNNNVLNLKQR